MLLCMNEVVFGHSVNCELTVDGMKDIRSLISRTHKFELYCFINQGRIQDFHLGGRKRLCGECTLRVRNPKSLSAGVQGPLKGPSSSVGF